MMREMEGQEITINGEVFILQAVEVSYDRQLQCVAAGVHYFKRGPRILTIKAFSVEGQAEINLSGPIKTLKRIITPSPFGHLKGLFDAN